MYDNHHELKINLWIEFFYAIFVLILIGDIIEWYALVSIKIKTITKFFVIHSRVLMYVSKVTLNFILLFLICFYEADDTIYGYATYKRCTWIEIKIILNRIQCKRHDYKQLIKICWWWQIFYSDTFINPAMTLQE